MEKHLNDFADFAGNNPYEKMSNAINEIIQNGKFMSENGVNTLWYKNGNEYYLVGISKRFNKKGDNNWIITSYKKTKGKIPDEIKGDTANLSAYSDEFNPLLTSKDEPLNSKDIIPQTKPQIYNTFNQSLKDAHDFFKANNKDAYNDKLFDDVIKVANALDIRFWYQPNAVYMAGSYTYRLNRIMLQSDNFSKENANTMLHELIHSVTSRAIMPMIIKP